MSIRRGPISTAQHDYERVTAACCPVCGLKNSALSTPRLCLLLVRIGKSNLLRLIRPPTRCKGCKAYTAYRSLTAFTLALQWV